MEDKELAERLTARNEAYIKFLTDVNDDRKKDSRFFKIIIGVLIGLVAAAIAGIIVVGIHTINKIENMSDRTEKRMYEFVSSYDFTTSYNLDTGTIIDSDTSGNISFQQR